MSTGLTNAEVSELYRRYGYLLLRRIRALLRDEQLAEDALHGVFLKLMKYGAGVRSAESQLAWLYRVVERHCFDIRRLRAKERASPEVDSLSEPRAISTLDERGALDVLWGRLSVQERSVAVMLYGDGLSQEEASRRLGCSRQAVGKHVSAIRLLADCLAREPDLFE